MNKSMIKALTGLMLLFLTAVSGKPVDSQIYQRDSQTNMCTVLFETGNANAQLRVYADDVLSETITEVTGGGLTATIEAALVNYKFEMVEGGNVTETVDKVACGDAYLIYGQSNAEAGYGAENYPYTNDFIRTFRGSWATATSQGSSIGGWGIHLARLIMEKHEIPVVVINGAKGNTAIQHLLRDAVYSGDESNWNGEVSQWGGNFYKRMQTWVEEAGLTDGVRALLWHQGERQVYHDAEDAGTYTEEFMELREELLEDYPALEKFFLFQIRPGCGHGFGFSQVNESIRQMAVDNDDIEAMATLSYGVAGCHYGEQQLEGYQIIGADMFPLVDMAFYGSIYETSQTSPNIMQVAWTSAAKDELVLQFDQEVKWNAVLEEDPNEFSHEFFQNECNGQMPVYLRNAFGFDENPGVSDKVESGRAEDNLIYLQLTESLSNTHLAYPPGQLNGCYAGPYITRPDSSTGALMFHVEIKDELDPNIVNADSRQTSAAGVSVFRKTGSWIITTGASGWKDVYVIDAQGNNMGGVSGTGNRFNINLPQSQGIYFIKIKTDRGASLHRVTNF